MRTRDILGNARIGLCAAFFAVLGAPVFAAQGLTAMGSQLEPVVLSDVIAGVVEKEVALDAGIAEVTHVVVQLAGGQPMMRDRQGLFQPWDLDPANLADNGFAASNGVLRYKIFNQDLSQQNFPIRVTLYYRANGELKFGYFDVLRAN